MSRTAARTKNANTQNTNNAANSGNTAAVPADDTTFADLGLPQALLQVLHKRGVAKPFPIQAATIPDALARRDILGRAQTGSGKTLAFGLPTVARLQGQKSIPKQPRAIVLVPTRELAMQVSEAMDPFAHALRMRTQVVVGGLSMSKQIDALRRGVEIVIATPGRLTDLVERKACDLSAVDIVVLDEADHMADMGFLPAVSALLDLMPRKCQKLLFSATLDGDINKMAKRYLHSPVTHSIESAGASVTTMAHHILLVDKNHKTTVISEIANREGRTLIFARTKHGADRLADQLSALGVHTQALHGGKTQSARTRTLEAFREGRINALVATDVAARGIHVDGIDLVLHVDPAADHKDYLHRAGRTARAGESGTVVTLVLAPQRTSAEHTMRRAGVPAKTIRIRPGHPDLVRITDSREPSGEPVKRQEERGGERSRRGQNHRSRPPRKAAPKRTHRKGQQRRRVSS